MYSHTHIEHGARWKERGTGRDARQKLRLACICRLTCTLSHTLSMVEGGKRGKQGEMRGRSSDWPRKQYSVSLFLVFASPGNRELFISLLVHSTVVVRMEDYFCDVDWNDRI